MALDARLFVLDCLPNLADKKNFSDEEVRKRIIMSVHRLQLRHPNTPVLLVEHSIGLSNTSMDTSVINACKHINTIAAETFASLKQDHLQHIYLLAANDIGFDLESTVDGIHPNDIGMMKYADAYEKIIRTILKEEKGTLVTEIPTRQRRDYNTYDFMTRHEAVLKLIKEKMRT